MSLRIAYFSISTLGLLALASIGRAQGDASITDSRTPPEVAPGTPDGVYSLSHFDSYNGYTGSLTVQVPILKVGGRTAVGHTIGVPIASPWAAAIRLGEYPVAVVRNSSLALGNRPYQSSLYNPGVVYTRVAWSGNSTPCGPYSAYKNWSVISSAVVTTVTFVESDGTEHQLVDTRTNGQPIVPANSPGAVACQQGFVGTNRGNTFRAMDGSDITFTSDLPVVDPAGFQTGTSAQFGPVPYAGWLYFRDGTRYRVDDNSGNGPNGVTSIEDRNGNLTAFSLDGTTITDPNGRQVTVSLSKGNNYNDAFTYYAFGKNAESVTVTRITLDHAIASGQQVLTCNLLFPGNQTYTSYCGGSSGDIPFVPLVVQSITLADGTKYKFDYNSYGEIADVTLPTGGRVSYQWPVPAQFSGDCTKTPTSCLGVFSDNTPALMSAVLYRRLLSRTEYADGVNPSHITSYSYLYSATDQYGPTVTTVTEEDGAGNPLAIVKHHYFGNASGNDDLTNNLWYSYPEHGKETLTETIDPMTGKTLRQTVQAWNERPCASQEPCWWGSQGVDFPHDNRVTAVQTTEGSVARAVNYTYSQDLYNNITDTIESDWGAGTPGSTLRHTQTSFLQTGNIVDLPRETSVYDGSANLFSDTKFNYDENLGKESDGPGIVGHDLSYAAGSAIPRGNLTSVWSCLGAPGLSNCRWVQTTSKTYDIAGNVTSTKDAKGNITQFSYTDSYSDGQSRSTYAYPTTVTNANNQKATLVYDYNSGKTVRFTDPNAVSTNYAFSDPFNRLTQIIRGDGGQTNVSYPNPQQVTVRKDQATPGDKLLHTETYYDGFGRESSSVAYESATSTITTSKTYDALGRVYTTTNPSRSGDRLGFATTYKYDALGRAISVSTVDGAATTTCYSNSPGCASPTPGATGSWVLVKDQAGNQRQSWMDGVGRLTKVIEDPGTSPHLGYVTTYGYDPLGDLTAVNQSGLARGFVYDSFKRLVAANNPENASALNPAGLSCSGTPGGSLWTMCYSYDDVGNVLSKFDNRQAVVWFSYDSLNRVTAKVYTGPSGVATTTGVTYCYDGNSGQAAGCPSVAGTNYPVGRLTGVLNGNSQTYHTAFDPVGHVVSHSQATAGYTFNFTYAYNLAGSLRCESYPTGRTVVMAYDGANRVAQVANGTCPAAGASPALGMPAYVTGSQAASGSGSAIQYAPHGAPSQYFYGNNVARQASYNSRLQLNGFIDSLNNVAANAYVNATLSWYPVGGMASTNNGNLMGATYVNNGSAKFTQTYTYDGVNRLQSVTDTGGYTRAFGYDAFGNMWVTGSSGIGPAGNTPTSNVYNGHNQFGSGVYDAAGNETSVNGNAIVYDAENRQASVTGAGVAETYLYDGDGRRVEKMVTGGSAATVYVYDALGQLAVEYGTAANGLACTTCYLSGDHLGSTRLVTDQNGNLVARHDYLPFGEEIAAGQAGRTAGLLFGGADAVNQKFTGKERDAESGLDYFGARYYGSGLGRWTSPDPYSFALVEAGLRQGGLPGEAAFTFSQGFAENPQNWNRYAHVRGNPLRYFDPTGAAPAEGHHLITGRKLLTDPLAKDFANFVKSGPLSGSGYPNQPGFNELHRAYNAAVEDILAELEKTGGSRNSWSLKQWRDAANQILSSEEPAIKEFLDELESENPGAKTAIAAAISGYRVSISVIVQLAAEDLMTFLRSPMLMMVDPKVAAAADPQNRMREEVQKSHANCLLDRKTGQCIF